MKHFKNSKTIITVITLAVILVLTVMLTGCGGSSNSRSDQRNVNDIISGLQSNPTLQQDINELLNPEAEQETGSASNNLPRIPNSNVTGNSPNNISNDGMAVMHNGVIYFSNLSDGGKIYSMNRDGSNLTQLNDYASLSINIVGDRIYYAHQEHLSMRTTVNIRNGGVFSMNLDGSDHEKLFTNLASSVTVVGDRIFFLSRFETLVSMSLDGSDLYELDDGTIWAYDFIVYEDRIYYTRNSSQGHLDFRINSINFDGSDNQVLNDTRVERGSLSVAGNHIYFSSRSPEENIYRMDLDGNNLSKVIDDAWSFNIDGNKIYFMRREPLDTNLYSANLDGSGQIRLSGVFKNKYFTDGTARKPHPDNINIVDDLVIYTVFYQSRIQDKYYSIQYVVTKDGFPITEIYEDGG